MLTIVFICSCNEWMVGAPCKPETDKGTYYKGLESSTYALETRSVQCKNSICITKTEANEEVQKKYSFCSCRCEDKDGHKYDRNSDKYDDLCECPSGSECSPDVVNNNIEQIPDTIKGSYCVPSCISEGLCFQTNMECKPPKSSKEPWKWECKVI
jgi:hypothetical protein